MVRGLLPLAVLLFFQIFCSPLKAEAIKMRIGILHDSQTQPLMQLVQKTIANIHLSSDFDAIVIDGIGVDVDSDPTAYEKISSSQLTAVIVVAKEINCGATDTLMATIPFYFVSGSQSTCTRGNGVRGIYLYPPNDFLFATMVEATNRYQWSTAIVLEEANKEFSFAFSDMQDARDEGLDTMAFEATIKKEELERTLNTAKKQGVRSYVLMSRHDNVEYILQAAEELELTTRNFHWFIPNVFVHPNILENFVQRGVMVSLLYSPLLTPLANKLIEYRETNKNSDKLVENMIVALTVLALNRTAASCRSVAIDGSCFLVEDGEEICNTSVADILASEGLGHVSHSEPYSVDAGTDATPTARKSKVNQTESECVSPDYIQELIVPTLAILDAIFGEDIDHTGNGSTIPVSSGLQATHEVASICFKESSHTWNYGNDTCSQRFVQQVELPRSNFLYVVEYTQMGNTSKSYMTPLITGGYSIDGEYSGKSTYDPLLIHDVTLPDRDLLVGAIYHSPWLTWEVDETTGKEEFDGFLYNILEELSKSMNFTFRLLTEYNIRRELHSEAAVEQHMLNVFNNNSVDLFLHAKSVHGNQLGDSNSLLLSASVQQPSMYLLTKRVEKTQSVSIWQFMLPFREESWILFWSTFPFISLLMAYINKKNPNEYDAISHEFGPDSEPSDHLGILNSLWFNFAAICGQGADIVPRSTACKFLTGAWWGFVLLVLSAYTANMTAFMTQVNTGGINSLQSLASQQEFEYGIMEANTMLNLFLPDAKDKPYTTMYDRFKKDNRTIIGTQEEAFRRVLNGGFYLIASFESSVDALAESCDYELATDGFYQYQMALPFPKGSIYMQVFNDHIKRLRDTGTIAALEKSWFTLERRCVQEVAEKGLENQLDIKAFIGMYVFLIIGVTGGILICALETGWIHCGGISGVIGRSRVYQLDVDRKEILKANELFEREFKTWEGGWEVWRCREWRAGDAKVTTDKRSGDATFDFCKICLRPLQMSSAPPLSKTLDVGTSSVGGDSKDSGHESALSKELNSFSSGRDELHSDAFSPSKSPPGDNESLVTVKGSQQVDPPSTENVHLTGDWVRDGNTLQVTAEMHLPEQFDTSDNFSSDLRSESAQSYTASHPSLASGTLSLFTEDGDFSDTSICTDDTSFRYTDSRLTYNTESVSDYSYTTGISEYND